VSVYEARLRLEPQPATMTACEQAPGFQRHLVESVVGVVDAGPLIEAERGIDRGAAVAASMETTAKPRWSAGPFVEFAIVPTERERAGLHQLRLSDGQVRSSMPCKGGAARAGISRRGILRRRIQCGDKGRAEQRGGRQPRQNTHHSLSPPRHRLAAVSFTHRSPPSPARLLRAAPPARPAPEHRAWPAR
jgi:hypothetical protein